MSAERDEVSPLAEQDVYVAGRLDIWKTASAALKTADINHDAADVHYLAEFLAGDNVRGA